MNSGLRRFVEFVVLALFAASALQFTSSEPASADSPLLASTACGSGYWSAECKYGQMQVVSSCPAGGCAAAAYRRIDALYWKGGTYTQPVSPAPTIPNCTDPNVPPNDIAQWRLAGFAVFPAGNYAAAPLYNMNTPQPWHANCRVDDGESGAAIGINITGSVDVVVWFLYQRRNTAQYYDVYYRRVSVA